MKNDLSRIALACAVAITFGTYLFLELNIWWSLALGVLTALIVSEFEVCWSRVKNILKSLRESGKKLGALFQELNGGAGKETILSEKVSSCLEWLHTKTFKVLQFLKWTMVVIVGVLFTVLVTTYGTYVVHPLVPSTVAVWEVILASLLSFTLVPLVSVIIFGMLVFETKGLSKNGATFPLFNRLKARMQFFADDAHWTNKFAFSVGEKYKNSAIGEQMSYDSKVFSWLNVWLILMNALRWIITPVSMVVVCTLMLPFAALALVTFVIDCVLTTLLVCSSKRALSAVTGTVFALTAEFVLYKSGVVIQHFLPIGILSGILIGCGTFWLRHKLEELGPVVIPEPASKNGS